MTTENQLHDKIGDDLKAVGGELRNAGEEGAAALKEQAEAGIEKTAEKLEGLSDVIDQVASSLSEQDKEGIANYVHDAADKLASLAQRLQDRSMDELTEDAKRLARQRPAAFMLGSVALGFGLTRFLKASGSGHRRDRNVYEGTSGGRWEATGGYYETSRPAYDAENNDYDYTSADAMGDGETPSAPGGPAGQEALRETARYSSAGS